MLGIKVQIGGESYARSLNVGQQRNALNVAASTVAGPAVSFQVVLLVDPFCIIVRVQGVVDIEADAVRGSRGAVCSRLGQRRMPYRKIVTMVMVAVTVTE
jgi:hypothetical protein